MRCAWLPHLDASRLTGITLGRRKLAKQKVGDPSQGSSSDDATEQLHTPDSPSPPGPAPPRELAHIQRGSTPLSPGTGGWVMVDRASQRERLRALVQHAYEAYTIGGLRPTNLHALIRINVLDAMARNAASMGFPVDGLCAYDYISPYTENVGPHPQPQLMAFPAPSCPERLRPTPIQRRFPHHPWIDLFPFPRFRDNMILAIEAGILDDDELCLDVAEALTPVGEETPALIVWGEAWDYRGWEVNPPFLRRWGWLLRGCPEMLEATNHWRVGRGERRIVYEEKW